jgi:hypothetical protein
MSHGDPRVTASLDHMRHEQATDNLRQVDNVMATREVDRAGLNRAEVVAMTINATVLIERNFSDDAELDKATGLERVLARDLRGVPVRKRLRLLRADLRDVLDGLPDSGIPTLDEPDGEE